MSFPPALVIVPPLLPQPSKTLLSTFPCKGKEIGSKKDGAHFLDMRGSRDDPHVICRLESLHFLLPLGFLQKLFFFIYLFSLFFSNLTIASPVSTTWFGETGRFLLILTATLIDIYFCFSPFTDTTMKSYCTTRRFAWCHADDGSALSVSSKSFK